MKPTVLPVAALLLAAVLSSGQLLVAAESKPAPAAATPRPYPDRLQWWAEARFGMFIHWGPVSLKGTEISWSRANTNPKCPNHGEIPAAVYDNLYKDFNPTKFDAAQWVGIAKAAGVKYIVLTAKHCDGFLLWHSQASDYNISPTPFQRDICAELAKAARAQGIRIGWYFSPMDWRDPDFRTERNAAFLGRMQAELRELLSNYGPIDLLWFDWDGHEPLYDQARTYELVKTLQPKTIINNRLDLGRGNNDRQILSPHAEYYTPEQHVGAYDDQRPWESCMTTSRKNQWAWGGTDDGVKSLEACLGMLIRCAGGDGNMLLNVGPMPTGEIAPEQANLLQEMGAWLAKYGESIYGTRGGPFKPGDYGVSTRKGNTIYLHVLEWPDEALKLPAISAKVVRSRVLGGGKAEVSPDGGGPGSLRSRSRPPAAGHRGGARTRRFRARTRRDGGSRRGFPDHQSQGHRLERLPAPGGIRPGQSRGRQQRDPLGHRLGNASPRGWKWISASRRPSAAPSSGRPIRNCNASASSPSSIGRTSNGSRVTAARISARSSPPSSSR